MVTSPLTDIRTNAYLVHFTWCHPVSTPPTSMHTLRILVLLVSSLEYVRSQEVSSSHQCQCIVSPLTLLSSQCSKVDFPPLPFHYRADLQYNILHKERFLRGRCSFTGPDCGEAAPSLHGIPIHELGRSVGFSEVFDGRESREAAKITTMMEFVDHDSDEVRAETE